MTFGIDEVGRGCWAGPLVVAAVHLAKPIEGLDDSKKLSPKKRAQLVGNIDQDYNQIIIISIPAATVDELGLTGAMRRACSELFSSISKTKYDRVIIDGNINFLEGERGTEAIVGADGSISQCMAASIVAKEYRDDYMRKLADKYPAYGFDSHVGYGTKAHKEAIGLHGLTPEHRRSFKPIKEYEAAKWGAG